MGVSRDGSMRDKASLHSPPEAGAADGNEPFARELTLASSPRIGGRVGLLAGDGRFPELFAQAARRQGIEVVCVAVRGHASASLKDSVDRFYWAGLGALGRTISLFRQANVDTVVMAGKIHKVRLISPLRVWNAMPDWRGIRMWMNKKLRRDNADDSLLLHVIEEFKQDGIRIASALEICPELLVDHGPLTRRQPTPKQRQDIAFGWKLAKAMGDLDVGQSVAVKDQAVLAVEAIEGTDQAILRAGQLCPSAGFVVVKVAKPKQDVRFDVPTVGVQTIDSLKQAGAAVLAIEANRTILLDRDATIQAANRLGIVIVALTEAEALAAA